MLDSGDWLNPRRSHEVGHWTKPPLTYWAIAASVAAFGSNPWAARLPAALAYLLCVWFCWRIARRLAPGSEASAAVIYATMPVTVGAAQLITTDYVLAACLGLAMWAFVEARFPHSDDAGTAGGSASVHTAHHPRLWIALMWVGFALAFIAKGRRRCCRCPQSCCSTGCCPGAAIVHCSCRASPSSCCWRCRGTWR